MLKYPIQLKYLILYNKSGNEILITKSEYRKKAILEKLSLRNIVKKESDFRYTVTKKGEEYFTLAQFLINEIDRINSF